MIEDVTNLKRAVANWVCAEFLPIDIDPDRGDLFEFAVPASTGSGFSWNIPDILTVSLTRYPFVPQSRIEVISFDVSPRAKAILLLKNYTQDSL